MVETHPRRVHPEGPFVQVNVAMQIRSFAVPGKDDSPWNKLSPPLTNGDYAIETTHDFMQAIIPLRRVVKPCSRSSTEGRDL